MIRVPTPSEYPFLAGIDEPSPQIRDYDMSAHGRNAADIERSMHGAIAKSIIITGDYDAYETVALCPARGSRIFVNDKVLLVTEIGAGGT
jgi:hypothetical protein